MSGRPGPGVVHGVGEHGLRGAAQQPHGAGQHGERPLRGQLAQGERPGPGGHPPRRLAPAHGGLRHRHRLRRAAAARRPRAPRGRPAALDRPGSPRWLHLQGQGHQRGAEAGGRCGHLQRSPLRQQHRLHVPPG